MKTCKLDLIAMKTLEELKSCLEKLKPKLEQKFEVKTIGIFGSYTRGEQTKKSDVDILVEFSEDAKVGFSNSLISRSFCRGNLM